jgi:tetratricopeptide (TPR) repeat protein
MGIFNIFKKKKPKTTDLEYEEMFGNKLDNFAKDEFNVNLKARTSLSEKDILDHLLDNSIPECSEHAHNKYRYAEKLYKQGKLDGSIKVLNDAINLGNIYPVVFNRLAIIYRKQKNYQAELETINTAIGLYEGKNAVQTALRDFKKKKNSCGGID